MHIYPRPSLIINMPASYNSIPFVILITVSVSFSVNVTAYESSNRPGSINKDDSGHFNYEYLDTESNSKNEPYEIVSVESQYLSKSSFDDLLYMDFPIVVTPTRFKQAVADVPAAITLIEASTIKRLGFKTIPEILQLVPGMAVRLANGLQYVVSYHGTKGQFPRRMQVMLDGMTLYTGAISTVNWTRLPVVVEDIARIEVTRSPNASVYGTNAYSGIINIISKTPTDLQERILSTNLGSTGSGNLRLSMGGSYSQGSYSVAARRLVDKGYDHLSEIGSGFDEMDVSRFTYGLDHELLNNDRFSLKVNLLKSKSDTTIDHFSATGEPAVLFFTETSFTVDYNSELNDQHELHLQIISRHSKGEKEWEVCGPPIMVAPELHALYTSNPLLVNFFSYVDGNVDGEVTFNGVELSDIYIGYLDEETQALALAAQERYEQFKAAGIKSVCGFFNENIREMYTDIEIQDTIILSPSLRLAGVAGLQFITAESETFLNGSQSNVSARLLMSLEYDITSDLILNGGVMIEKDGLSGSVIAPRLALNYHLGQYQTIRSSFSTGTRSPDIFEQKSDWSYRGASSTPIEGLENPILFAASKSTGGLNAEYIISREIGYHLNVPKYSLSFDLKIFSDTMYDLISQIITQAYFNLDNSNSVSLKGGEFQLQYKVSPGITSYFSYGYLDADASTLDERTLTARHSGSAYFIAEFDNQLALSAAYTGTAKTKQFNHQERLDVKVMKTANVGDEQFIDVSLNFRHHLNDNVTFSELGYVQVHRYDNLNHVFFELEYRGW